MQRAAQPLLSRRQAEIANLIVAGKSNREISVALILSERTVENHVAALFGKLRVGSRVELVVALFGPDAGASANPRPVPAAKTNLPFQRTSLVGRETEIAHIVRLLA